MARSRSDAFEEFFLTKKKQKFGSLRMEGNRVYSYDLCIAVLYRERGTVVVPTYDTNILYWANSRTTKNHRSCISPVTTRPAYTILTIPDAAFAQLTNDLEVFGICSDVAEVLDVAYPWRTKISWVQFKQIFNLLEKFNSYTLRTMSATASPKVLLGQKRANMIAYAKATKKQRNAMQAMWELQVD